MEDIKVRIMQLLNLLLVCFHQSIKAANGSEVERRKHDNGRLKIVISFDFELRWRWRNFKDIPSDESRCYIVNEAFKRAEKREKCHRVM